MVAMVKSSDRDTNLANSQTYIIQYSYIHYSRSSQCITAIYHPIFITVTSYEGNGIMPGIGRQKINFCNFPECNGPLTRYVKLRVAHAPGMPGTFSPATKFKGKRMLMIPACITARASRTCRDVCRDCLPAVAGKTFLAFPAHVHLQFDVFGKRPMKRNPVYICLCTCYLYVTPTCFTMISNVTLE